MPSEPARPPTILRGIDRASFAVALATRLRSRGMIVGATAVGDFVAGLELAPPLARSRLYWTARITLVRRRADLALFDAVFDAVFNEAVLQIDPHARRSALGSPVAGSGDDSYVSVPGRSSADETGSGLPWVTLPPAVGEADDSESLFAIPQRLPSEVEALADVPFELLSSAQVEMLGRWIEAALRVWPTRRSRRMSASHTGRQIAIRPTIAASRRTGWEPIRLVRVKPVEKPRRVVMLCESSARTATALGRSSRVSQSSVGLRSSNRMLDSVTARKPARRSRRQVGRRPDSRR